MSLYVFLFKNGNFQVLQVELFSRMLELCTIKFRRLLNLELLSYNVENKTKKVAFHWIAGGIFL